jgi:hypothetical protein
VTSDDRRQAITTDMCTRRAFLAFQQFDEKGDVVVLDEGGAALSPPRPPSLREGGAIEKQQQISRIGAVSPLT